MAWSEDKEQVAREILALLYKNKMIRTFYRDRPQGWTLVSGLYSPLYIQLRPVISYPAVFEKICNAMARMVMEEAPEITRVIGIAMAGVPIAAGMAIAGKMSGGFTRKMDKVKSIEQFREAVTSYGEHALVEGELTSGDRIGIVDDLVTRFDSKLVAMEQVRHEIGKRDLKGVECRKVIVVLDREQGGQEAAAEADVELLSLIPFKTKGLDLLKGVMNPVEWETVRDYLSDPDKFQNETTQKELKKLSVAL